ncbi:DUF2993 domain-containing protein [Streptomyces sp. NPDC059943]|uniref:LmeA family phospholipid-binding protein n=1 Tax=Streptomyces sp. NPDC059943 TaxID=3347010 RepID=UPI00365B4F90
MLRPSPYDELARLATPDPDLGPPAYDPATYDRIPPDDDDPGRPSWPPPDHRRRRPRRFGFLVRLTLTAAVCAAFLLPADRLAAMYAQDRAADQVQRSLGLATRPDVDIHGFPFLTQVAAGKLDRVDVAVPDVAADRVSLAEVRATAEDVRIVGDLPTSVRGAVVGSVDGDVLLSFDDLNRELGSSQVKFTGEAGDSVRVAGALPVAGHEVRVRADAHVRRDGARSVSTTVDGMRLDVAGIATYRPGKDRAHSGLRLRPEAAARIADEAARAKALLAVPAVVDRLGVPKDQVDRALRGDKELRELTGSPRFVKQLMKVNLVDVVVEHPWLLEKAGVDPELITALLKLRPPELSEKLSLSFELPRTPGDLRLRDVTVERDGIRADLAGSGIRLGGEH